LLTEILFFRYWLIEKKIHFTVQGDFQLCHGSVNPSRIVYYWFIGGNCVFRFT